MDRQEHKIDHLFREKLDGLEVTPSPKAWSSVEDSIRKSSTPYYYWIAASIVLLLLSWIGWPYVSGDGPATPILSEVNRPMHNQEKSFDWFATIQKTKQNQIPATKPAVPQSGTNRPAASAAPHNYQKSTQMVYSETTDLTPAEPNQAIALPDEPDLTDPIASADSSSGEKTNEPDEEVKTYNGVKIIYIASTQTQKPTEIAHKKDTVGALKKFIAFTERIDPGDVLADMKAAKDDLLNGRLGSKKQKSSL